ncbi:MAG: DUF881 domain-containing protein [Nocardioidaceae bacterium]
MTEIMSSTLDADYQAAADRARELGRPRRPPQRTAAALVVLLFGMMLAVSALRTQQLRPATAAERSQLVAQIHAREDRLDALHSQVSALEVDVAAVQTRAADRREIQRRTDAAVTSLAAVTGAGAVTGPGVRVVVSDAPGAVGSPSGGVILDSDLQALVNALWTAGAEAISINGNRLTSLTAIRFAGRAITVDYHSLRSPYVVEAVGDPQTLPARLLETPGGQAWLGLQQNFGIGFDTQPVDSLVLPADPILELHHAQPVVPR